MRNLTPLIPFNKELNTINGSLWNGHVEIRPVSTVVVYGDVDGDGHISSIVVTSVYNILLGQ